MPGGVDDFVGGEGERLVAQVRVQHLLKHLPTAHTSKRREQTGSQSTRYLAETFFFGFKHCEKLIFIHILFIF